MVEFILVRCRVLPPPKVAMHGGLYSWSPRKEIWYYYQIGDRQMDGWINGWMDNLKTSIKTSRMSQVGGQVDLFPA